MVGIDDMELYLPKCYLPIATLAKKNNLDVQKLQGGLGLYNMSIPDADEDVVTMAGEALINLLKKNPDLEANQIGRIYVGTESSVDGAKPIASYLTGIVNQYFKSIDKPGMMACDSVDLVFACIGAVDAMENCLLWLTQQPTKKALVIATDNAKYELASPGEYTQGAGAVAVLLSHNPRMLKIPLQWGCSTACIHDFFKPHRYKVKPNQSQDTRENLGLEVERLHNDCPIFDGPVSNQSYQDRMVQAYDNFVLSNKESKAVSEWSKLVFHQPYAYHGRRIFSPLFLKDLALKDELADFSKRNNIGQKYEASSDKIIRKSEEYRSLVTEKIAHGEKASMHVGNMYTASIFLCLMSTLFESYKQGEDLTGQKIGFVAYGSGAKSKVFEGIVSEAWKERCGHIDLDAQITDRKELSYEEYYHLHKGVLLNPVSSRVNQIYLNDMGVSSTNYGSRNYLLV